MAAEAQLLMAHGVQAPGPTVAPGCPGGLGGSGMACMAQGAVAWPAWHQELRHVLCATRSCRMACMAPTPPQPSCMWVHVGAAPGPG